MMRHKACRHADMQACRHADKNAGKKSVFLYEKTLKKKKRDKTVVGNKMRTQWTYTIYSPSP